jgi:hypothetical protein
MIWAAQGLHLCYTGMFRPEYSQSTSVGREEAWRVRQVLKVDTRQLTEQGGAATVTAWVDEIGDLYAASGAT